MNHRGLTIIALKVFLGLAPLLVPLIAYVIYDPFGVVHHYDRKNHDPKIVYNRDYISTETFLANYKKENYDSFILGNSRTLAFQSRDWKQYIEAKDVFHFDASKESLYGIYKKIMFLDREGVKLKNCLMILDEDTIQKCDNIEGHLCIKHPKVSQESTQAFQMEFLRAFITPRFLIGYVDYKIHHRVRSAFSDPFLQSEIQYDPITNDVFLVALEDEIQRTGSRYYESRKNVFYNRDHKEIKYTKTYIKSVQKKYFEDIKRIFEKYKTNYRIIISPAYDQKYFSRADLQYLENLFGKKYVSDFSGVNEITDSVYNYYEILHYRPVAGRQMLKKAYLQN